MANVSKKGRHGTLYLWRVRYKDNDPASPIFSTLRWAYSREQVEEEFIDDEDDDWALQSISKVKASPSRAPNQVGETIVAAAVGTAAAELAADISESIRSDDDPEANPPPRRLKNALL